MLVADAPGFHDDRLGRPLVGAAGELLAELLASIGLERREVYVTTLVKCRPAGTQSPAAEEIAACRDKLERQIELVRPAVVAAIGDLATRALAGGGHGVSQAHGQVRRAVIAGRELCCSRSTTPLPRCTTPACCRRSRPTRCASATARSHARGAGAGAIGPSSPSRER